MPEVVVSRIHQPAVDSVFIAIESKIPANIVAAFTTNRNVLANYLDLAEINSVISETATATTEPGAKGARFIIVRDLHNTIIMAHEMLAE